MPWLTGAGTGTTIARAVLEEERDGARGGKGEGPAGGGGHGVAEGRARGVPARADRTAAEHTPRPWSAAASDLHERVCARQRAVAGAGCGASGSAARTARPTRGGADEEGSVGPGGAGAGASRHREAAARARGAARAAASKWQQSAFAPRGDLREAIRADEGGGVTCQHTIAQCHGAVLPRRPRRPPRPERAPAVRGA